nr:hypothetical protein [Tanacetum cinerariifolium]
REFLLYQSGQLDPEHGFNFNSGWRIATIRQAEDSVQAYPKQISWERDLHKTLITIRPMFRP